MKPQNYSRVWSVLLLLVATAVPGHAASFSAELIDTRAGQTQTNPFSFQDKSYRYEVVENGQTLIIMVDGQSGTMRLVNPSEKAYYEAGPDDPMNRLSNPFGTYAYYARKAEVKAEGTEPIAGIVCTKQALSANEQLYVRAWVSEEFGFPLKVEVPIFQHTVELRNLKRGPQDPALFAVPAGYKLVQVAEEEVRQPPWVGDVAAAPVLAVPFEKKLAAGEIVRMRPQAGRWIKIEGTNAGPGQGNFTEASFKGGKSLGSGEMSTLTVDPNDSGAVSVGAKPGHTDEIVVRVNEGAFSIKTAFVAPSGSDRRAEPASEEPASSTPAAATEPTASVNAPSSADMASQILVEWMGPANPEDFVAVARSDQPPGSSINRTSVREGNPLKLWMPGDPGEYELRYVQGRGTKVLAKSPITVNAVATEVEASGPVNAADWIEVKWTGPAAPGDFISVARAGQPAGAALSRIAVKDANPVKVRAPSEPGEFEVRYVLGRGTKLLAKTAVTVNDVTAQVEPPASAKAGARFEVRWQGPNSGGDVIALARPDQAPTANVWATATRQGNPLQLRAPKEPGVYEVRYILFGGRLLAKAPITINAP